MEVEMDELLKKVKELEAGHDVLMQEISKLRSVNGDSSCPGSQIYHGQFHPASPQPRCNVGKGGIEEHVGHSSRMQLSSCRSECAADDSHGGPSGLLERHYLNILQCMGQSVHMLDLDGRIVYWNRSAECLYGYSVLEATGKYAVELLLDPHDFLVAMSIIQRITFGENWTGTFPVKNKFGERFTVIATNTPFYDDDGSLIGILSVTSDTRCFLDMMNSDCQKDPHDSGSHHRMFSTNKSGPDLQHPLPVAVASRITNMATKVTSKIRSRMGSGQSSQDSGSGSGQSQCSDLDAKGSDLKEDVTSRGANAFRKLYSAIAKDRHLFNESKIRNEDDEGRMGIHKIICSKAEMLFSKKNTLWPWKGHEQEIVDANYYFARPWLHNDLDNDNSQKTSESSRKWGNHVCENQQTGNNGTSGSWSSSNANSTSSGSGSIVDTDGDSTDHEIIWEDLVIGEQVGQGSCGTVYHALWYGSDVAVKVFSRQEYSDDVILSFGQEVSLMKKLRHPNILLFMGAVTSPQRLCIVTEFLPRGNLFRFLQKNNAKLDWRRRIHIAMDIARGMNYLHRRNPPIVHRDLKSSNLLVDKNWSVKVADFGLSRLKIETYIRTKTGKGTPQWMAPEVLRNEPSNEKSDVYSYGVILWEIVTQKIPWGHLNSMQVVGAVGFMDQRLDIPEDLDPQWGSIIKSCWHSEPHLRPTFQELLDRFKDLQRKSAAKFQMQRMEHGETTSKELNPYD